MRETTRFEWLDCSVSDPFHFDSDPDSNPQIHFVNNGSGSESEIEDISNLFTLYLKLYITLKKGFFVSYVCELK